MMGSLRDMVLLVLLAACLAAAGCTLTPNQVQENPVPPAPQVTIPLPPTPPAPTAPAPENPPAAVTVVRYVSQPKDLKDPDRLFALQVPVEWNVSTIRLARSDAAEYRTELVPGGAFSLSTYPASRSREQEYRDRFRLWDPAPEETAVTINGIRFDRYESRAGGMTRAAYVSRTSSANERGYASVLVFAARDSARFERDDFEQVVASFRYLGARTAGAWPGEEIPVYDPAGNPVIPATDRRSPMFSSADWDTPGTGDDSGSGSPAGTSARGGSGGTCGG